LWELVEAAWGPARSIRPFQPFLVLDGDIRVEPDSRVRRVVLDEFDVLYPACVAMFTEEVGIDPELGGASGYRARVAQLISQGWAFAIIEDGQVLFKTEVGAATADACQLQGVWVRPDRRGEEIAAGALAAVIELVRATVAPVVTLYVNDHNASARRTYERVGFAETDMFASVLI
jgi:predicted GNAT family acetyltransferase